MTGIRREPDRRSTGDLPKTSDAEDKVQLPEYEPTLLDHLVYYGTLIAAWIAGEGGRAIVAGAAGGFVRWILTERRRVLDGGIAVVTGAIFAKYTTGPMLVVLQRWLGDLGPDAATSAAFAAGLCGMGVAKVGTAGLETWLRRRGGQPDA